MQTCEICGHTSEDVKEYPTHKNGRDTTEYQCTDIEKCLDRKGGIMFTKGKWYVDASDFQDIGIFAERAIARGDKEDCDIEIAQVSSFIENDKEITANANLIALSPRMFELLKECESVVDATHGKPELLARIREILQTLDL